MSEPAWDPRGEITGCARKSTVVVPRESTEMVRGKENHGQSAGLRRCFRKQHEERGNMTLNPTKEEIRKTGEKNERWLAKHRNLRWDGTQNHPLFAWAEACILSLASERRQTSMSPFGESAHGIIDCHGYGLARAALLGLREKGEVILGREDPPIPTKESQDLKTG